MSIKSFIQIIILTLIISIIIAVYYKYFKSNESIVEEINSSEIYDQEQFKILEKKVLELEKKNNELNSIIKKDKKISEKLFSDKKTHNDNKENSSKSINSKLDNKQTNDVKVKKSEIKNDIKDVKVKKSEIKNEIENTKVKDLVKDIEYTSVDQKGNTFHLLANSGRSNINNSDILDLINVKGKITSEKRDTIYIVSDFAQYNSLNLNSKFYKNVIINYQDKEITCVNFDIDMETNKAMAYNDVLITDPKSKMKAGIVEFDLKTKDININPESAIEKIEVVTN